MTPQEREVMQMALDALEHGLPIIEDFGGKEQLQLQHKAIAVLYEALRAALAQPEQEPVACGVCGGSGWVVRDPEIGTDQECFVCDGTGKDANTAPPQRKCPGIPRKGCDYLATCDSVCNKCGEVHNHHQMVAAFQSRREWQSLTDEEQNEIYRQAFNLIDSRLVGQQIQFARAIEAKLKEKNA